jgi:RNA polymerase sigma-70 factor (ECF subfamily)
LVPGGPPPRLRYVPTRANGQVAVGTYLLNQETGGYLPLALDVRTLDGALIADVTAFRTPSIFPHFGLPDRLSVPGDHGSPVKS